MKNLIVKIKEYSLASFKFLWTMLIFLKEVTVENNFLLTTIFFIVSFTTESFGMVLFTFAFLLITQIIYHWNSNSKNILKQENWFPFIILTICYILVFQIWYMYILKNVNTFEQKVLETKYYPSSTYYLSKDNQLILKEKDGKITVEKLNEDETKELLLASFYTDDKSVLVKEEREVRFFNNLIPVRYTTFRFIRQNKNFDLSLS
jgi:hypothetical protein